MVTSGFILIEVSKDKLEQQMENFAKKRKKEKQSKK